VIFAECLLHRVQLAVLRQPLDGEHALAFRFPGEHRAGLHRLAVDMDDAGAALRRIAADMRAGETQALTQVLDQQCTGISVGGDGFAVHRHGDRGHGPSSSRNWGQRPSFGAGSRLRRASGGEIVAFFAGNRCLEQEQL
jgi:hypothetical protein